jgi:stage II sporulation protein M
MKSKKERQPNITRVKESWSFIKESKNHIYFALGTFLLFILLAVIFPAPKEIELAIRETVNRLILATQGLDGMSLVSYIFVNNLGVSLIAIFAGIFFCFVPFFLSVSNGYVLGYVSKIVVREESLVSLWRLLPHGIFELPAILISLGIGIRLGISLMMSLNAGSFRIIWKDIKNSFKVIFFIIIPLLVIAAIIEGSLISITG